MCEIQDNMKCGAERRIKENTRKRKKTEKEKATRK
jgi:hypothetical protein